MLKKIPDAFVKRVIRNRKLNKEAYSVFVNLVGFLDESITVSEDLAKSYSKHNILNLRIVF